MRTGQFAGDLAMTPAAHQAAGRIVLVALAVAAVGAFTVLQIMAASGRRAPAARRRRPRPRRDWRSLPQDYLDQPDDLDDAKTPSAGRDGYGPLWRYGAVSLYTSPSPRD